MDCTEHCTSLSCNRSFKWLSKGKVVPVHAIRVHSEMEVQLHSFLTLALDGGQWSTSWQGRLNPSKETRYLSNRSLCGPQHQSGRFGEQKNLFPLTGFEPRIVQPAALTLYWRNLMFFLTVHHSIELFHLPTLIHNSLFINNMYVTLLSSTCFEH